MALSTYTREFRYNWQLAYPVILGMLGHTLIGIVDKLMVGRLGVAELAAVSLGNSFIFIAMSVGIGFSTAITPIVAAANASRDHDTLRSGFHNGLLLTGFFGVILFAMVWLSKPFMAFMGQPEDVISLASPYLDWVAFSLIPAIAYQGYKQFADGLGLTKYPMYAILLSNIVHIPLNFVLIYGVWIFPEMGVTGAAIGTVISRLVMLAFMHFLLMRHPRARAYFKGFSLKSYSRRMSGQIAALGFPSAAQMLCEVALFTSAIWLCGGIGKDAQAANEIALSIATLTYMFAMGLSVAGTIRVSRARGLGEKDALIRVARSVFLLALLIEAFFALVFILGNQVLPKLFLQLDQGSHAAENLRVVAIAAELLVVASFFQLFDGLQAVVLGALRGVQDVKVPMWIAFVSYWLIGFPVAYWLSHGGGMGATGVWYGLLVALFAASVFLYLRFHWVTRRSAMNVTGPDHSG